MITLCGLRMLRLREIRKNGQKHDQLLQRLIFAIREDIYGREAGINSLLIGVHLVGSKPKERAK